MKFYPHTSFVVFSEERSEIPFRLTPIGGILKNVISLVVNRVEIRHVISLVVNRVEIRQEKHVCVNVAYNRPKSEKSPVLAALTLAARCALPLKGQLAPKRPNLPLNGQIHASHRITTQRLSIRRIIASITITIIYYILLSYPHHLRYTMLTITLPPNKNTHYTSIIT